MGVIGGGRGKGSGGAGGIMEKLRGFLGTLRAALRYTPLIWNTYPASASPPFSQAHLNQPQPSLDTNTSKKETVSFNTTSSTLSMSDCAMLSCWQ